MNGWMGGWMSAKLTIVINYWSINYQLRSSPSLWFNRMKCDIIIYRMEMRIEGKDDNN
jgi:hypothetical protein